MISVKPATSLPDRLFGMLRYKKPIPLLFKTRFGIHTFGMKYALDVIILNNKNEVISLREHMKPNRLFFWNPKYSTVIELPGGEIKKRDIKIGSKIELNLG